MSDQKEKRSLLDKLVYINEHKRFDTWTSIAIYKQTSTMLQSME